MDFKNTEFDADFDFIEKAAKNRMGNEKVKEKWYFLTFITVFSAYNLCGWYFKVFSTDQHRILRFMVPISNIWGKNCFLIFSLFANFKAKFGGKGSKKQKNVVYKCGLESHFTSTWGSVL